MLKGKRKRTNEKGFTLVEIAIVMVIIGLLIGGVLKGQAMIDNAKVKNMVNDIEGMRAATLTFYDRYGMYPGDESSTVAPTGDSNNGDNDGLFDETDGWEIEDLRLAGLLAGSGITLPKNAFGGTLRIDYYNPQSGNANYIIVTNIPAEVCQELDTKYDDGDDATGDIQGDNNYDTNAEVLCWSLN